MKEVVVISGKGGTGKTSIVASFAMLAESAVLVDCDVDAPDLAILMEPLIFYSEEFSGGSKARIHPSFCSGCGKCVEVCRFGAIAEFCKEESFEKRFQISPIDCEGCGVCRYFCPDGAIEFKPSINGSWYVSRTRAGTLIHAELGVAQENSGKLVSILRNRARRMGDRENADLLLVDGAPGIGCPVIASITGADLVLLITEPSISGFHDSLRVMELTEHFHIKTLMLINKWNLNAEHSAKLEGLAQERGVQIIGRIPYDNGFTEAQDRNRTIVEYQSDGTGREVKNAWRAAVRVLGRLEHREVNSDGMSIAVF